jgi:hypothetical protein
MRLIQFAYMIPLFISATLCIRSFISKWPVQFKIFSLFLWVKLIRSIISMRAYLLSEPIASSDLVFSLFKSLMIVEYLLVIFVLYKTIEFPRVKKITFAVVLFFLLTAIIDLYWLDASSQYKLTNVIACLILVSLSLVYFKQLLIQPQIVRLVTEPMVWICLGIFVFNSGVIPLYIALNYENFTAIMSILIILNCLEFIASTFYLVAFLCNRPSMK